MLYNTYNHAQLYQELCNFRNAIKTTKRKTTAHQSGFVAVMFQVV